MDGHPFNCSEDLIRVYLVPVKGPLDLDERWVTLSQFDENSEFARAIKAEDYKMPKTTRMSHLVFSLVGESYIAIFDLGDLDKPQVLSFKLIFGEVLNWNLKMAGCGRIWAIFCPGMNRVALVKIEKKEGPWARVGGAVSSEHKLIQLVGDHEGIFNLSDLSVKHSGSLLKLENGNMLFLGEGGRGVASHSDDSDRSPSQELQDLRGCSVFGIEFYSENLEPIAHDEGILRFFNDWNANPTKVAIIDSYLVLSPANRSSPSHHYLTLLNKELKIVDQDQNVELKDSEFLISFDSFGWIVSFSYQNCFLIHRIDHQRNKLILKNTIRLDHEIKEIRFSEHLNVPRSIFMVLLTDQKNNHHLLEIKQGLGSLELVKPRENCFVQEGGSILINNDHLFLGVEIRGSQSKSK